MKELEEIMAKLTAYMARAEEEAKEQCGFNDLTITQMNYLEMICQLTNPNLTELAIAMKLTKPTVTVLVDRLIEKELIYKMKSDADSRSAHLHLTEKGRMINEIHEFAHKRMAAEIQKRINSDETTELMRLLDKIVK